MVHIIGIIKIIIGIIVGIYGGKFIVRLWHKYNDHKDKREIRDEMLKQKRYRDLYQEILTEDVDKMAIKAAKEMKRHASHSRY